MGLSTTTALANGVDIQRGAETDANDKTYVQLAIETQRATILQPGSSGDGDILGVWIFNGIKYCFRNATDGLSAVMYKSTSNGWEVVNLGREIAFTSGGTTQIVVGNTITGTTSGAFAVITEVVLTSGTWGAGDAAGYFYFDSQTGTFQSENIDVGASTNLATIAGDSTAITLSPGGKYEFINYNFYGQLGSLEMYGCNGVNRGFKYNGTSFAFITTGMPTDTPTHVIAHKKHLFFSFDSSIQNSSIGDPLGWSAISGASEIATGDTVVGFTVLPDDSLGIFTRNSTYIMYGSAASGSDAWNLTQYSNESGAIEWSIQRIGKPIYLDDRGLTNLTAVQAYGNFENAVFSDKIRPLVQELKLKTNASTRIRAKNQYRIFFSNKTFLIASFDNNKFKGFTECTLDHEVNSICSEEDITTGNEVILFGAKADASGDAYVYELEKGTSFDGQSVEAFLRFAYNNIKSPENIKRYFKAVVECTAPDTFTSSMAYDFNYGEREDISNSVITNQTGGFWNISNWNEFTWGGKYLENPEMYISGSGENIGLFIFNELTYEEPHTFHGAIIHYSKRGLAR